MRVLDIYFVFTILSLLYITNGYTGSCSACINSLECLPPKCSCCNDKMPLTRVDDIPQMVFFTFDDAINSPVAAFYRSLFNSRRKNPNGCPIKMTLFVSHESTKYNLVKEFYMKGMEIGAHSVTHSHMNQSNFRNEAKKQKQNIARRAGVPVSKIKGWRSPFLEPVGDTQPEVLKDLGYTYDATLTIGKKGRFNNPIPFTLDYGWPYDCKIKPCPSQSHKNFWEIPVVSLRDYKDQFDCVYVDGCNNPPPDEETAFQFLWDNFESYYRGNRAPFGINMHASWFYYPSRLAGMERFIIELGKLQDVYIVSASQVIEWLKTPTPLADINSLKAWECMESRKKINKTKLKERRQRKRVTNYPVVQKQETGAPIPKTNHLKHNNQLLKNIAQSEMLQREGRGHTSQNNQHNLKRTKAQSTDGHKETEHISRFLRNGFESSRFSTPARFLSPPMSRKRNLDSVTVTGMRRRFRLKGPSLFSRIAANKLNRRTQELAISTRELNTHHNNPTITDGHTILQKEHLLGHNSVQQSENKVLLKPIELPIMADKREPSNQQQQISSLNKNLFMGINKAMEDTLLSRKATKSKSNTDMNHTVRVKTQSEHKKNTSTTGQTNLLLYNKFQTQTTTSNTLKIPVQKSFVEIIHHPNSNRVNQHKKTIKTTPLEIQTYDNNDMANIPVMTTNKIRDIKYEKPTKWSIDKQNNSDQLEITGHLVKNLIWLNARMTKGGQDNVNSKLTPINYNQTITQWVSSNKVILSHLLKEISHMMKQSRANINKYKRSNSELKQTIVVQTTVSPVTAIAIDVGTINAIEHHNPISENTRDNHTYINKQTPHQNHNVINSLTKPYTMTSNNERSHNTLPPTISTPSLSFSSTISFAGESTPQSDAMTKDGTHTTTPHTPTMLIGDLDSVNQISDSLNLVNPNDQKLRHLPITNIKSLNPIAREIRGDDGTKRHNSRNRTPSHFLKLDPTNNGKKLRTTKLNNLLKDKLANGIGAKSLISPLQLPNEQRFENTKYIRPKEQTSVLISNQHEQRDIQVDNTINKNSIPASIESERTSLACNNKSLCMFCACLTIPGNISAQKIPQFVYITIEGPVNFVSYSKYMSLFNRKRLNPNDCPISGTLFIPETKVHRSHSRFVQRLFNRGVEIGLLVNADSENVDINERRIEWSSKTNIPLDKIRGVRLKNMRTQFNLDYLKQNDMYDASDVSNVDSWPYIVGKNQTCSCLHNSTGTPEVSITSMKSPITGRVCTYADSCDQQPSSSDETFEMLMNNFRRHYDTDRKPVGIHIRHDWFGHKQQHNLAGLSTFINTILMSRDVYIVSIDKLVNWTRKPVNNNMYSKQNC